METVPSSNPEEALATPSTSDTSSIDPSANSNPSLWKWILVAVIILAAVGVGLAANSGFDWNSLLKKPAEVSTSSGQNGTTGSISGNIPAAPACASGTTFEDLTEALKDPSKVCQLNLVEKGLTEVPKDIAKFTNITRLSFSKNQIKSVPDEILSLSKLIALDFNFNQIDKIPDGIDRLEKLEVLSFGSNKLTSVSTSVGKLKNLLALGLSYNELTSLPNELASLDKLIILYVRDNKFSAEEKERIKKLLPGVDIIFE